MKNIHPILGVGWILNTGVAEKRPELNRVTGSTMYPSNGGFRICMSDPPMQALGALKTPRSLYTNRRCIEVPGVPFQGPLRCLAEARCRVIYHYSRLYCVQDLTAFIASPFGITYLNPDLSQRSTRRYIIQPFIPQEMAIAVTTMYRPRMKTRLIIQEWHLPSIRKLAT